MSCDDPLLVVRPEDDRSEGCPVLNKQRTVFVDKGVCGIVEWEMRDRDGNPVDLSDCSSSCDASDTSVSGQCYTAKARVSEATVNGQGTIYEVNATIYNDADGIVRVALPSEIVDFSGIYLMDIGIMNPAGNVVMTNRGFVSVEKGLWGDLQVTDGPPTIMEIRLTLRDTAVENDLLNEVEYSDSEIMHAILQPVRYFNEIPPPLGATYNASNFPWKGALLNAIAAQLLMTAAHWYRRNKLNSSHGGLNLADRDRDNPYMQVAQMLQEEWKDFVLRKKVQLNAEQCYGNVGSEYDSWGN